MKLAEAIEARESLAWLARVLVGKAKKPPRRAPRSLLDDQEFVRQILREARLLRDQVGLVLDTPEWRRRLIVSTEIDWDGLSDQTRLAAVEELSRLLRGLPSEFTPGVMGVLDAQGRLVIDKTHRAIGGKAKRYSVDPVFSQTNERAVAALRETTTVVFADEYRRRANNFSARAQATIAQGLEDGLDRRGIAAELRREFSETAIAESYWETVAANHVARARSFSSAATYAELGVEKYEVVAIRDTRTTEQCLFLDGTVFSLERAMDAFDALEGARSVPVLNHVAPFLRRKGREITVGSWKGATVAARMDGQGGFVDKLDPAGLQAAGIHMPPYHHRCRTTVAPVLEDLPELKPVPDAPADAGGGKPGKKPKRTPDDPGPDPVEAAKSPRSKRKAIVKQVQDGLGFVPGSLPGEYGTRAEKFWGTKPKAKKEATDELAQALSAEFLELGRKHVAATPSLKKAWNRAIDESSRGALNLMTRDEAVQELVAATKNLGAESIPKGEREDRKKAFVASLMSKAQEGDVSGKRVTGGKGPLDTQKEKELREYAAAYFDAFGPLAEEALKQNKEIFRAPWGFRPYNDSGQERMVYTNRADFFHELSHSLEHHVVVPRAEKETSNPYFPALASFWVKRVEQKDPDLKKLSDLLPGHGYESHEVARKDKWADPYVGRVYATQGSSEVVSMLSEGLGGNEQVWRRQLTDDPDALLEFVGWLKATLAGEATRRARLRAATTTGKP